jgi:hypothetical protein
MRPTAKSSLPPFSISSISASPRMTRLRMIRLRSGSRLIRHDRALSGTACTADLEALLRFAAPARSGIRWRDLSCPRSQRIGRTSGAESGSDEPRSLETLRLLAFLRRTGSYLGGNALALGKGSVDASPARGGQPSASTPRALDRFDP